VFSKWTKPDPLLGREGVNGSSPSEGFAKAQQIAFLLPGCTTLAETPATCPQNLSPNISRVAHAWLEKAIRAAQSTSLGGRAPGRHSIGRRRVDGPPGVRVRLAAVVGVAHAEFGFDVIEPRRMGVE
jgi:hypothetical protein